MASVDARDDTIRRRSGKVLSRQRDDGQNQRPRSKVKHRQRSANDGHVTEAGIVRLRRLSAEANGGTRRITEVMADRSGD